MKFFTVVLDAFDGKQYGMLRICVQEPTDSKKQAEATAIKQVTEEGFTQVKVMMVLE